MAVSNRKPSGRTHCSICNCSDLRFDHLEGDIPLELSECPRCGYRATRSLLTPRAPSARAARAARPIRSALTLPHAA